MSHPEQVEFVRLIAEVNAAKIQGSSILEIGSFDVYGTIRAMFTGAGQYVGVDLADGPGVDVIASGHSLPRELSNFDIAVCCEVFEHDTDWRKTLDSMLSSLRPGGLLIVTCAGPGRPEHGTQRTTPDESPGSQAVGWDHYENVDAADLEGALTDRLDIEIFEVWTNSAIFDVYAAAIRTGNNPDFNDDFVLPSSAQISQVAKITPLAYRVSRWPIRLIMPVFGRGAAESFGRVYWTRLRLLFGSRVRGTR